jgi:hypothetical protein
MWLWKDTWVKKNKVSIISGWRLKWQLVCSLFPLLTQSLFYSGNGTMMRYSRSRNTFGFLKWITGLKEIEDENTSLRVRLNP